MFLRNSKNSLVAFVLSKFVEGQATKFLDDATPTEE